MLTLLITALIISVLIIVHEGGHYLAAKLGGAVVEEFSIGFGPPVYQRKRNKEVFSIRAIPFGGYVKLKGQERKEKYEPDDFNARPFPAKLAVVLAGPIFNLLLAIFLYFMLYSVVGYPDTNISHVGKIEENSLAQKIGIQVGDSFISINGRFIRSWGDFWQGIRVGDTNVLVVKRVDSLITLRFYIKESDTFGVEPYIPPVVEAIERDGPAYRGGIRRYDTILMVDTVKVRMFQDMGEYVRKHPNDTLIFTVKRGNDTLKLKIVPMAISMSDSDTFGKIGIAAFTHTVRMPLWDGLENAVLRAYEVSYLTLKFLFYLLTGRTSFKNLGGIITVGKLVHSSESMGSGFLIKLSSLINLAAALSINLFLLNLIPFPALDGFHALIFTFEAIIKRPLKREIVESIQFVGFVALVILMVVITFMDIAKLWHR